MNTGHENPTVIGLFHEGELETFFGHDSPMIEIRTVRGALEDIGKLSLNGSIKIVSMPADESEARSDLHMVRTRQFEHSAYGTEPDPTSMEYYRNHGNLLAKLINEVFA